MTWSPPGFGNRVPLSAGFRNCVWQETFQLLIPQPWQRGDPPSPVLSTDPPSPPSEMPLVWGTHPLRCHFTSQAP